MSNTALFSIIVPVYNTAQYLNKCIDSLLKQTYQNFEILLIDDGSTDDSPSIIDDYSTRFENIISYHIQNSGVSSARNLGLQKAHGEYIVFVDSDDYVDKMFLQTMVDSQADLYVQGWKNVRTDETIIDTCQFIDLNCFSEPDLKELIISGQLNCICAKRFSHNIITKNNLLFDVTLNYGEDTVFAVQYMKAAKTFESSSLCLYNYVQFNGSRETLSSVKDYLVKIHRAKVSNQLIAQLICDDYQSQRKLYLQRMRWVYNNALVGVSIKRRVVLLFNDKDYRKTVKQNLIISIKRIIHKIKN